MKIRWLLPAAALTLAACASTTPAPPATDTAPPPTATPTATGVTIETPSATPSPAASRCDQALWAHIYHPYRLHVISACTTVTGTVQKIRAEPDGDLHIQLRPDPPYATLINSASTEFQDGDLVLEAICAGTITQADAVTACQGFTPPALPEIRTGDHIQVTGSYVLDTAHGWTEIHPVTSWQTVP